MLRSMFSGVTGLRAHQTRMDVIGNNIANINTVGFKAGRARFAEQFSQLLQAASPGNGTLGGTNPFQIGMGTGVAGIDNVFTQGTLENTGLGTDMAIQGDGFFILGGGQTSMYSRAGAFSFDAQGRLVDPGSGFVVQGYMADASGSIAAGTALGNLQVPLDTSAPAHATGSLVLHGNLDAAAATGAVYDTTATVYDSLGNKVTVTLEFTKTANADEWGVTLKSPTGGTNGLTTTTLKFDPATGGLAATGNTFGTLTLDSPHGGSAISINLAGSTVPATPLTSAFGAMTQTAGDSSAFVFSQNGYASGTLSSTSIDSQGHIVGAFSNGVTRTLGQVALARFANDAGLTKGTENTWEESLNSGRAVVGQAGSGSFGSIAAGTLEGSNVDLAQEFTDLIVAQRGFQANARMVTTGDEMLQEMVNIKR